MEMNFKLISKIFKRNSYISVTHSRSVAAYSSFAHLNSIILLVILAQIRSIRKLKNRRQTKKDHLRGDQHFHCLNFEVIYHWMLSLIRNQQLFS